MSMHAPLNGNSTKASRFQRLLPLFAAGALMLGGLFGGIPSALAQLNCMQDNYTAAGNNQDFTCAAKEVFIDEDNSGDKIIDVTIIDGCDFPGDTATVNIVASIHFN